MDVVFVVEGNHVKTVPVKIGISDDNYWEITDGLKEGDEIVTGGYQRHQPRPGRRQKNRQRGRPDQRRDMRPKIAVSANR